MRTVEYKGKRRTLYVDVNNGSSVLSLPKNIGVNDKGKLRLYYASDLLEKLRSREIEPTIYAQPYNTFGWWPSHESGFVVVTRNIAHYIVVSVSPEAGLEHVHYAVQTTGANSRKGGRSFVEYVEIELPVQHVFQKVNLEVIVKKIQY